ncbi:MAG: polysaccharide deacetylase family protein [Nitrospirae bacterium]|nr:polysaccharide deacetylase family protein [Nitrospirota bacterium]
MPKRNKTHAAVPVVMYHGVGVVNEKWIWKYLTCPWELFEKQLKWLRRKGYETISLRQLYEHMKNGSELPALPVLLTFDDGYLDNWVFAYPLLKKYGFRGAVYVNPEFADPRDIVRKNLEDVWYRETPFHDLETKGFLSWPEMKIMEAEGVIDIQSHSMSHTWYFCEEDIVGFHHPGNDDYPWLFWNALPEKKSFYMSENQENYVPYGTPIYKHGRSLGTRRYYEDKDLTRRLVNYVESRDGNFFQGERWADALFREAGSYKSDCKLNGRFETETEQDRRYRYELSESKKIIEDKLNKKVDFLCWPGGAYNNAALKVAMECGYISSTRKIMNRKNVFGEDPSAVHRIGCETAVFIKSKFISFAEDAGLLSARLKYFKGRKGYLWVMRLQKMKYLIKFIFRKLHGLPFLRGL